MQESRGSSGIMRHLMVAVVLSLCALAPAPAHGQTEWDLAAENVDRLAPAVFFELPSHVLASLERDGCTVPQAWGEDIPHNVVGGSFAAPDQNDWAVLCSVGQSSSIVVFWGGPVSCPSPVAASLPDRSFLQGLGADGILFSRGISTVQPDPRYWEVLDGPFPDTFTHSAISDAFYEKGATAYYCQGGRWLKFTSGD